MSNVEYASELDLNIAEDADFIQLVGLKLGEEEYAIDVLKIQEIIRTVEITIVPRSDPFVLGVMNLRGKVIPVIDLRVRFNLEKTDFDKATRVIVVRFDKENIGFVVDEVTQVISINRTMVEPTPPLVGAVGQEYILGICKFNERLIILLDIDRVAGGDGSESALRKRISETKDLHKQHLATKKSKRPIQPAPQLAKERAQTLPPQAATAPAPQVAATQTPPKYSMADEADKLSKPVITAANESAVLADIQAQSKVPAKENTLVAQQELDALMAGARAPAPAPAPAPSKQEESPLSMDELIAIELAKREAETEELNKKKQEKKK